MITRRNLLKGIAAGAAASAAATTLIRENQAPWSGLPQPLHGENPIVRKMRTFLTQEAHGFGLAPLKPEGGHYYPDPMDDPQYRGLYGQGGKYHMPNGRGHQS